MSTTRSTAGRTAHDSRPARESVRKRIGERAYRAIMARDGHACVYCGATEQSSGRHLHLDHLTPRSEGGRDEVANLVVACHYCNSSRKTMSIRAWAAFAATTRGITFTARQIRGQARRRLPE